MIRSNCCSLKELIFLGSVHRYEISKSVRIIEVRPLIILLHNIITSFNEFTNRFYCGILITISLRTCLMPSSKSGHKGCLVEYTFLFLFFLFLSVEYMIFEIQIYCYNKKSRIAPFLRVPLFQIAICFRRMEEASPKLTNIY